MKIRPSKAFIILGSAHLGFDTEIIEVFAEVAKHYRAHAIHLGPITDPKIVKRYHHVSSLKGAEHRTEAKYLLAAEEKTVSSLQKAFGKVTFVTTLNQYIREPDFYGADDVERVMQIGRHLSLSAVPPNGDKVTASPITKKARNYYKTKGSSWILPHPTPSAESYPREGLNQAHNYYTTGSLKAPDTPLQAADMYQSFNLPCAILVVLDKETDEFHARQLHVEYVRNDVSHRIEPVVCDDGKAFTRHQIVEVGSEDKACHSTDDHSPYQNMGVLAATRAQNELHQPSVFINGGDASDMEPVCRHTKDKPLAREKRRIRSALDDLRWLLDMQTNVKSIKKKVLVDSNHHDWLTDYVAEHPELDGLLDWATLSLERFSDWDVYLRNGGSDKTCKFGDLSIRHGDAEQVPQAADIFGKYLGGHYHRYRCIGRAVSVGPACGLGPKYLQNSVTAWQNQITSITCYKGKTAVAPKTVLHDEDRKKSRFVYGATIYEVDYIKK